MQLKHILVAVNSLSGRDAAFERALALAQAAGAELYLLHAVPATQAFSFAAAERLERIADLRRRAENAGVRVHAVEQHGDPAATIDLHARARGVDLIVLGSEAQRGWGRSRSVVAEKVIRRTDVPTLVVASDTPDGLTPFRNVLVAVDLSPESRNVVRGAVGLTRPEAVQLTLMHTVKGVEAADAVQTVGRWKVPEFRTLVIGDARRSLEALMGEVPAGLDTRVQVSAGSPARTILDHSTDVGADLVVVGRSRGLKVLGSTALRLLRRQRGALLVVPGTAQRAGQALWQHAA
jgi:nucleotide-binding universal stress UspA family protein